MNPAPRSRKRLLIGITAVVLAVAAIAGYTISGASVSVDPTKVVVVERGTMVKSVVATGKVEPITKMEIKSKANGIIQALRVDVDSLVNEGDILAELDKDQLLAQVRGAEANLLAARAALEGAEAQLKKNIVEAEGPDADFARRAYERAQPCSPSSWCHSRRSTRPIARSTSPRTASARHSHSSRSARRRSRKPAPRSHSRRRRPIVPPKISPTPPFAHPSVPPSSPATSKSAARCPPSSTSAPTPAW